MQRRSGSKQKQTRQRPRQKYSRLLVGVGATAGLLCLVGVLCGPVRRLVYAAAVVAYEPLGWTILYDKSAILSEERDGFDVTFKKYPIDQQGSRPSSSSERNLPLALSGVNRAVGEQDGSEENIIDSDQSEDAFDYTTHSSSDPSSNSTADLPWVDMSNADSDPVPAIIHHIAIGIQPRQSWLDARDACLALHPTYKYMFWDDAAAEELIRTDYPELAEMWHTYRYPIQRADSLRYMVLYKHGGIFLDMDLSCKRSLGPLRQFDLVAAAAVPTGVSNGFIVVKAQHPFMRALVDNLKTFKREWFFLPYTAVMISTGCYYISALWAWHANRDTMRILAGPKGMHQLSGKAETPLFNHLGSSSWHSWDAGLLKHPEKLLGSRIVVALGIILATLASLAVVAFALKVYVFSLRAGLLTRQQQQQQQHHDEDDEQTQGLLASAASSPGEEEMGQVFNYQKAT